MSLGSLNSRQKKFIPPKLMITSMMDMFTIILIFLLFQFSEKPETIQLMDEIELPTSTAKMEHTETIKLMLTLDGLHLDEKMIARVENGAVIGLDPQKPKSSVLYRHLAAEFSNQAAKVDDRPQNHILLLCDKRHSFKTINSIVKTAAMAGYPNFQFAVLKE